MCPFEIASVVKPAAESTNVRDNGAVSGLTIFDTLITAPVHRLVRRRAAGRRSDFTSHRQSTGRRATGQVATMHRPARNAEAEGTSPDMD